MDEMAYTMTVDQHEQYDDLIAAMRRRTQGNQDGGIQPSQVEEVIADAIHRGASHAHAVSSGVTRSSWPRMTSLLSDRSIDHLAARRLGVQVRWWTRRRFSIE